MGEVLLHPKFLTFDTRTIDRFSVLVAWLPFFGANIFFEEILWHGVLLPRQESYFGRSAWIVSGFCWLLFHAPFGVGILVAVWPALFIIPYVTLRRRNTWTGVVMHAGLNGPGFVAVTMGWV